MIKHRHQCHLPGFCESRTIKADCEMVQWLSQTMRKLNVNDLTLLSLNSQPKQDAVV